jgi:Na+/H+ antiporter NhaC
MTDQEPRAESLRFRFGTAGAVAPFVCFLAGVAWLGLSGAPDERGFWPILVGALGVGMLLCRDRSRFAEESIRSMCRPLVAIMVLAWLLAGVLGRVIQETGLVQALVWLSAEAGVEGSAFVGAAFAICCVISTATGTSLGTLLVCGPLLYPAGGALGAEPGILMGAILGGATFGDNLSPISDTTIASALTQNADIAGVVRSRLRYALLAAAFALAAYLILGGSGAPASSAPQAAGGGKALVMLLVPVAVVLLLLRGRNLLEGLLFGIGLSILVGLAFGLLEASALLYVDAASFGAKGLVLEGMERGIGASIFTFLLMGLVGPLEATGLIDRLVDATASRIRSERGAEVGIVSVTSAAVLLTTHSTVALLSVGSFARRTGERFGVSAYRRANLMDITVCIFPFVLPYMIPTILAASMTAAGEAFAMPRLDPFTVGVRNFHSLALLGVLAFAIATGFGRRAESPR